MKKSSLRAQKMKSTVCEAEGQYLLYGPRMEMRYTLLV